MSRETPAGLRSGCFRPPLSFCSRVFRAFAERDLITELDCTDVDTALRSLSEILSRSGEELRKALSTCTDATSGGEAAAPYGLPIRPLQEIGLGEPWPAPDSIIWFHATRAPSDISYECGLLPTEQARPLLRQKLRETAVCGGICTSQEWPELLAKAACSPNQVGKPKSSPATGFDAGPHGFLIREWIIASGIYYLDQPEEVREFCSRLGERGKRLAEAYKAKTFRTIVKFRSAKICKCALPAALLYVWKSMHDGKPEDSLCGFDGGGVTVPASDILDIKQIGE